VILGPALNIQGTPLCGRNYDYFGEDPWLAGRITRPS
jgi:beta-glucosidase